MLHNGADRDQNVIEACTHPEHPRIQVEMFNEVVRSP